MKANTVAKFRSPLSGLVVVLAAVLALVAIAAPKARAASFNGTPVDRLLVQKGLLRVVNKAVTYNGKTIRTFDVENDSSDGLNVTSGASGMPGFSLGRVPADSNPAHDSGFVAAVSASGTAILNTDYGDDPALMLFGPDGAGAGMTRVWYDVSSGGGILTGAGLFKGSVFTSVNTGTGKGNTYASRDVTLTSGAATDAFPSGTTINSCDNGSFLASSVPADGSIVAFTAGERTFKVKLDGGATTSGGVVRVTCNVTKAYGS